MIYNVVMSPLRGFFWGGTLSAGIRGFVPNALALLKLSARKVTTFFLNMQILLGQIAFFLLYSCGFVGNSMWMVAFYAYL